MKAPAAVLPGGPSFCSCQASCGTAVFVFAAVLAMLVLQARVDDLGNNRSNEVLLVWSREGLASCLAVLLLLSKA